MNGSAPFFSPSSLIVSGTLILLLSAAIAIAWRRFSGGQWRWFALGAAVWAVGIIGKFATAAALNEPAMNYLASVLPYIAYMAAGSIYIGLLTGIFEIGLLWAPAKFLRGCYATPAAAVTVGVGAGVFEAVVLAMGIFASAAGGLLNEEVATALSEMQGSAAQLNPAMWLIAPVERLVTIPCHIVSRVLILYAMATGRWWYFGYGFAFLTAVDTVAGYVHISGFMTRHSTWWVELAILPFAVLGLIVTRALYQRWPEREA